MAADRRLGNDPLACLDRRSAPDSSSPAEDSCPPAAAPSPLFPLAAPLPCPSPCPPQDPALGQDMAIARPEAASALADGQALADGRALATLPRVTEGPAGARFAALARGLPTVFAWRDCPGPRFLDLARLVLRDALAWRGLPPDAIDLLPAETPDAWPRLDGDAALVLLEALAGVLHAALAAKGTEKRRDDSPSRRLRLALSPHGETGWALTLDEDAASRPLARLDLPEDSLDDLALALARRGGGLLRALRLSGSAGERTAVTLLAGRSR